MNAQAERHLAKAENYLGKGEQWYRKAAVEIIAAKADDPKLSNVAIGQRLGYQESWVRKLIAWSTSSSGRATPFTDQEPVWERETRGTKRLLREAPMEQIETIIAELSPGRQRDIAAAAGHKYLAARQDYDETEQRKTPAERKEVEAAVEDVRQQTAEMMAGFDVLTITNHLEESTDLLREMIAKSTITEEGVRKIDTALAAFLDEYRVAQAKVGQEVA